MHIRTYDLIATHKKNDIKQTTRLRIQEDGDWTLNGDVVSVEHAICRGISISPLKTDADGGNVASTNDDEASAPAP